MARWFQQLNSNPASLSRPESGFVSGDSRSERYPEDPNHVDGGRMAGAHHHHRAAGEPDDLCDEYLLVEGTKNLWGKLSAKKRRKLLALRLGKITTF